MATIRIKNEGPETIIVAHRIHDASTEVFYPQAFLNPGDELDFSVSTTHNLLITQVTISTTDLFYSNGVPVSIMPASNISIIDEGPPPPPTPVEVKTTDFHGKQFLWLAGRLIVKDS